MLGNLVTFASDARYGDENSRNPTGAPLTMAAAGYISSSASDDSSFLSINKGNINTHWYVLQRKNTSDISLTTRAGNTGTIVDRVHTSGTPDDTFDFVGGAIDSNDDWAVWGNGGETTGNTAYTAPTSQNSLFIGSEKDGTSNRLYGGIQYAAWWNVFLDAAERAALRDGVHPTLIRPANLVSCVIWDGTTLVDLTAPQSNWTLTGTTPSVGTSDRIILPQSQILTFTPAVAGGVNAEPASASIAGQAGTSTSDVSTSETPSGAATAGEAGTVTATTDVNETAPTAVILGQAAAPTVIGDASHAVTGAQISGQAGTSTSEISTSETPSGAEIGADEGAVTVLTGTPVPVNGAVIAGQAAAPTATGDSSVTLTGAAVAGQSGTATAAGDSNVTLAGVAISATAGTVTVDVSTSETPSGAAITGQAGAVTVTIGIAQSVSTAAIIGEAGTATATAERGAITLGSLKPTGLHHRAYGTFSKAGSVNVEPSGAVIAAQASAPTIDISTSETPSGAAIIGQAGTSTSQVDTSEAVTGAAIAGNSGAVSATTDVNETITSAVITGEAGTVTAATDDVQINVTGASIVGQAGSADFSVSCEIYGRQIKATAAMLPERIDRALTPTALPTRHYGEFTRDLTVSIVGRSAPAQAGVSTTDVVVAQLSQFGPHGLVSKERDFAPKQEPQQNVNATPSGAAIQTQWTYLDSANATMYPDGQDSDAESGSVSGSEASPNGAQSAAEAGTVAVDVSTSEAIIGAQISAQAGEPSAVENGVGVTVDGVSISGEAGTATAAYDWSQIVTGSLINAQASEVGIDTSSPLSVTVAPATIAGEAAAPALAGPHVSANVDGAQINGEADAVPQADRVSGGHFIPGLAGIRAGKKRSWQKAKREAEKVIEDVIHEVLEDETPKPVKRVSRKRKARIIERATQEIAEQGIFLAEIDAIDRAVAELSKILLERRRALQAQPQPPIGLAPLIIPETPPIAPPAPSDGLSDQDLARLVSELLSGEVESEAERQREEQELAIIIQMLMQL